MRCVVETSVSNFSEKERVGRNTNILTLAKCVLQECRHPDVGKGCVGRNTDILTLAKKVLVPHWEDFVCDLFSLFKKGYEILSPGRRRQSLSQIGCSRSGLLLREDFV